MKEAHLMEPAELACMEVNGMMAEMVAYHESEPGQEGVQGAGF
jgi:hypothetical protein